MARRSELPGTYVPPNKIPVHFKHIREMQHKRKPVHVPKLPGLPGTRVPFPPPNRYMYLNPGTGFNTCTWLKGGSTIMALVGLAAQGGVKHHGIGVGRASWH